jgi:hypothetical protein
MMPACGHKETSSGEFVISCRQTNDWLESVRHALAWHMYDAF